MTKLTKHTERRCNSRGIKANDLTIIMESGNALGDYECWMSNKDKARQLSRLKEQIRFLEKCRPDGWNETIGALKRKIQRFDKLAGKMVVADNDRVISAYHLNPKRRKWRMRRGQRKGYY